MSLFFTVPVSLLNTVFLDQCDKVTIQHVLLPCYLPFPLRMKENNKDGGSVMADRKNGSNTRDQREYW